MFYGRDDIYMLKLKHSLLYTHYRCRRTFPSIHINYLRRGCNYRYDCLNHIMQTCIFNFNIIIHIHNYVNNLLITLLNKYKFNTILEPHIRTRLGLSKLDLLTYRNYIVYIIYNTNYSYSDFNRYNRY